MTHLVLLFAESHFVSRKTENCFQILTSYLRTSNEKAVLKLTMQPWKLLVAPDHRHGDAISSLNFSLRTVKFT